MTWRNVLGMLILVGLCVAALFWMQGDGEVQERGPATLLEAFAKEDVRALRMQGDAAELELRRSANDSEQWEVRVGMEWGRADAIRVDEILGALLRSEVRTHWEIEKVTPQDLMTYGLTAPSTTVELELPGGAQSARFGKRTREGGGVYADRGAGTTVMVVPATAHDEILAALQGGLRDRRVTDLRTFDVKGVEIVQGGVTTLEAEIDVSQIWHVKHPFEGYADPTTFPTRIGNLVNEQWQMIVEDGAQDLARYGLAEPAATVTLRSKRGGTRTLLLGSEKDATGGSYVMEEGRASVLLVSQRFADAVLGDAADIRDRSFTRLGFGIEGVTVNVEGTAWVLHKAGTDWEVEKPGREPAEEEVVEGFLEQLRQWPVVEFLDAEDPADYGVEPGGDQIQVETEGGALTTLLIGKERADGNRYAQRKDDGGLVVVLGGPVKRVLEGWLQFKRRSALEVPIDDVDFIGRERGIGEAAADVTPEKWSRDLDGLDKAWKPTMGQLGAGLDSAAMNELLRALRSIRTTEWFHYHVHDADAMKRFGLVEEGGKAATAWIEVGFRSDIPDVLISIGNEVPDKDAYYAHQRGKPFVFLMDADVVRSLTAPLMKQE